jgi:preprotein translocase subunit SecD
LELRGKIERYEREKGEIQVKAKKSEDDYIRFSEIDDQFDASAAAMSVGIALSGVSALVSSRRLFVGAVVFLALGIALGVAGFLGAKLTLPFLGDWLAA